MLLLFSTPAFAQPSANFTFNFNGGQGSSCVPVTVGLFNNSSSDAVSFEWSVDGQVFSMEENPIRTITVGGTYQFCLRVEDAAGSSNQFCQDISFFEPPSISLTATPSIGCAPLMVDFTISSTVEMDSIILDFGNGVLERQNASGLSSSLQHTYTNVGNFSLTLTVFDVNGCRSTIVETDAVNIIQLPQPSFTASPRSGCTLPLNVSFTNTTSGTGNLSFFWDFGDGNTSNDLNPQHSYQNFGNYTVSLTVTDNVTQCSLTHTENNFISIGDIVNFDYSIINTGDCSTTQVAFNNQTQGDITSILWNFGDGNSSTDFSPTHTYTMPGCYTPTLSISTSDGCNSTLSAPDCIAVVGPVTLDYTSQGTLVSCALGTTINFSGLSPQAVAWQWDFGGLGSSTDQNPSFTFDQFGSFPITLEVEFSNGCRQQLVKDTVIVQALSPSFTSDTTEGCIDLEVQFTNTTMAIDPIVSYLWDFGDGNTSTSQNPLHIYTDTGTFDVTLIVESVSGCRDTVLVPGYIEAGQPPVLDFVSDYQTGCIDTIIGFTNNSSIADEWEWFFGDGGGSNQSEPMYQYQDTGLFDVTLIGWFNGCSDTLVVEDYIQISPPIAAILYAQDCARPYEVVFTDNSIGPEQWEWDFGDGNTSTDQNPVHTYAQEGTYTVTLNVINNTTGCSDAIDVSIIIAEPIADFSLGPNELCVGDTIYAINNTPGAGDYTYTYIFPPGVGMVAATANDPEPGFYFPTAGDYSGFELVVGDANGCTDTFRLNQVFSISGATADFSIDVFNGCPPLTINFTENATSTTGIITNYLWDFGDGNTSTASSPTHVFTDEGRFTVSLTVTNSRGCTHTTVMSNIIEVGFPEASFQSDLTSCTTYEVTFSNLSSGLSSLDYLWDFGDGNTSTEAWPVHTYAAAGDYFVCLTASAEDGCSDQFCDTLNVSGLIADFIGDGLYKSCPNPPLVTSFTDLSTNAVSWLWDFGDNTGTSDLQNPTHSYSRPGLFDVCLIVTDARGCRDTLCRPSYVQVDGPSGSFTADPTSGCQPVEVNFAAEGTNVAIYNWDFGDGTGTLHASTGPTDSVTHTYTAGGVYEPVLILEDASGCRVPIVGETIEVEFLSVDFEADIQEQCLDGATPVNFTNLITNIGDVIAYEWIFEGSNTPLSNEANPSGIVYDSAGYFAVQLWAATAFCTANIRIDSFIVIHPSPEVEFTLQPNQGCESLTVAFSDQSTISFDQLSTWNWDLGEGTTSDQTNFSHTYDAPGEYLINLDVSSDFGCSTNHRDTVIVLDRPEVVASSDGELLCIGESSQLNAELLDGNLVTYSWTPTNDLTCTNCPSPIASPSVTTMYTIEVTNPNGCAHRDSVLVRVGAFPVPEIQLTADTAICAGTSLPITAVPITNALNLRWDESRPGLSCYLNCTNPIATPEVTTTYLVTVTGDGGCEIIDSITVTILDESPDLLGDDRTICSGDAVDLNLQTGSNPVWSPATGLSCTNCPAPQAAPATSTTYTVEALNSQGCLISDTIRVNVRFPDEIDAGPDTTICVGEELTLQGTFFGQPTWLANSQVVANTGRPTVQPPVSTRYTLQAADDLCVLTDVVDVTVTGLSNLRTTPQQICEGESITLTVDGLAETYRWSPAASLNDPTAAAPLARPESTTTYTVEAFIGRCPVGTATALVEVVPKPELRLPEVLDFRLGQSVQLDASVVGGGRFLYRWWPEDFLSCTDCHQPFASPDSSTTYNVEIEDEFGCLDTAMIRLQLLNLCGPENIVVPTAFTPNNDGENDLFRIQGDPQIDVFRIFNRWGEQVFETNNVNDGWNGQYKGQPLNRDVYVYYIEGRCRVDGSKIVKTGDVTLIR